MSRRTPALIALLVLMAFAIWQAGTSQTSNSEPSAIRPTASAKPGASTQIFEQFVSALGATSTKAAPELIAIAQQRAARMRELIATDPATALDHALTLAEYRALPDALRPFVEQPFNTVAHLHAYPICDARGTDAPEAIYELELDGQTFVASPVGTRRHFGSKENTPLAGITLDDIAAVRERPIQIVSATDAKAFDALPIANPHPSHCFATGAALDKAEATVGLVGGKRVLFADETIADTFNRQLAELDQAPGPHSGSRVIFELADGEPGDGFNWDAAGEIVQNAADTWTETVKNVLFIRIDFSDVPGEATSLATLAAALATSSANISDQSYGKTSLNSTVSATTIRMPNPTSTYLPNSTSSLHTDAKNAYEAIHGAGSLASFDIIGVHFDGIGIQSSGGVTFSGLAGGSRQWLQGTTSPNTIIHEFGHNYGVGHASFWSTSDGSVVGTGASSEYGDPFDIMGGGPNPEGHFHSQAKSKLSWIESDQWVDADASGSGTYRIYRIDDGDTTGLLRGIRALKSTLPDEYYWLGYRTGIPGNIYLPNGAYLVWQRPGFTRSWLLDTTPGSPGGKDDAALAVGTTYSDNAAAVHFTPTATGGTGADTWIDINVQLGSFPGNSLPSVTLSGPTTADARTPLTFTASASDPDSDPLAYSWDFGDGALSQNTNSVSKTWVSGGTYTVTVTASDMKGGTATDSLTVTVSDPLDTWIERTSGTNSKLTDIATDGTILVAVSSNSSTYITSTDGETWVNGGAVALNARIRGVIHDGSQFIAVGYDYDFGVGDWFGAIFTSSDATSWTRQYFAGGFLNDVAAGGGVMVAVGQDDTVLRSTDGTTWTPILPGSGEHLDGVSYGGGSFVIASSGSGGGPSVVLTSTDGLAWTDNSAGAGTASWQGFYDVQYCNDRFLASGWYSKIRHSTDAGATFATNQSGTQQIPAFAFGNGVYLAAGIDKDSSDADINLISTDGANWTALTTVAQDNRNAAIFFADTFITVGDGGTIWQSAPFSAPAAGGFTGWLATHFPGGSTASADPDGDGLKNLAEYASGTDPNDPLSAARPTSGVSGPAGEYLTLTLTKDPTATDVTYSVEYCSDLINWGSTGITTVSETATELIVRTTAAVAPRGFLRALYSVPN